jgi:multiple sugar transport system permease protein
MLIWRSGFRDFAMGYAGAQAWLLGVIIMAITIINFLLARRWVFTDVD